MDFHHFPVLVVLRDLFVYLRTPLLSSEVHLDSNGISRLAFGVNENFNLYVTIVILLVLY